MKKDENGITLVALVITIIVLIILTGISIGAIVGDNGMISKSKEAKDEVGKMQNSTTQNRDALYGEVIEDKTQYGEAGIIGINLELEKKTDTSIMATASATDTKSEIISYTFYIRKITENDSAYVMIKKNDILTDTVICENLEKDMGYKVKVVAMDKDGVSKTAEKNIVLGEAIKISVTPISGPDSYPSTVMVTATSVVSNMDYIELPNGEKIEAKNGKFKLKTTYNSTKNGPIVFTAYDKEGNAGQLEYMEQNVINFETEWTFAEETTITVPVTGTVDVYIDYGDGTKENIASANPTHAYSAGKYTIKISGKCTNFSYNESTRDYLTGLKKWGCLENNAYTFGNGHYGCSKIASTIPVPNEKCFKNITSFSCTFAGCKELIGEIPIGLFDNCPKVKDFGWTFNDCGNLTGIIPEKLFDNCPKVTTFINTFRACRSLTGSIPEGLFDNCPDVTNFSGTFIYCSKLTGDIPAKLFKNNTQVTNFVYTFEDCSSLTGNIPEGLFNSCTKNTSFGNTFCGCSKLTGNIPAGLFKNGQNVKSFNATFAGCGNLTGIIPESLFDNCTNVTIFSNTFSGCGNLTGIPNGLFSKCTQVTTFANTFFGCNKISGTIPENLFRNCSNVTDFSQTFYNCAFSGTIPESLFSDAVNATNFGGTFCGCKINEIPEGLFHNNTEITNLYFTFARNEITEIPANLFNSCTKNNSFGGTFMGCKKLTSIPEMLFDNCTNVKSFGASTLDETSFNVNMGTFAYCTSLTGKAPELWNRSNVTSYYYCFRDCTGLDNYSEIPDDWK